MGYDMYAFQYATNRRVIVDKWNLTQEEALKLWNDNLEDFKTRLVAEEGPEMCVWSGMRNDQDYHTKEKYLHADDCVVVRGKLFELVEIS